MKSTARNKRVGNSPESKRELPTQVRASAKLTCIEIEWFSIQLAERGEDEFRFDDVACALVERRERCGDGYLGHGAQGGQNVANAWSDAARNETTPSQGRGSGRDCLRELV
jgi:hypothetical protein